MTSPFQERADGEPRVVRRRPTDGTKWRGNDFLETENRAILRFRHPFDGTTGGAAWIRGARRFSSQRARFLRAASRRPPPPRAAGRRQRSRGPPRPDRGRDRLSPTPPSEPYGRFSRIRLSSRWFLHRDRLADNQAGNYGDTCELHPSAETLDLSDRALVVSFQTVSSWRSSASNSTGGL